MRFQVARIAAKDWSPRVWSNVLIVVVLAVGWLVASCGGTPTQPAERCGSVQFVNGQSKEPKVAVILIDGVGSQEDAGGKFYPVSVAHPDNGVQTVTSYCPVDPNGNARNKDRGWPVGLEQELRRWSEFSTSGGSSGSSGSSGSGCGSTGSSGSNGSSGSSSGTCSSDVCKDGVGLNTDKCLVARLADAGAVLLPYSYTGAILSKETSAFTFNPYQASDTQQRPHTSVEKLDDELRSIHTAWPQTRIVIIGHSYGGLIAELWWEAISVQHIDHRGVVHAFSLDSPINGVDHCYLARAFDGGFVSDEWCQLWDHRQDHDQLIINFDALDPSFTFTPVGTPNDPTYNGLISGGGDLQPQVVYSYSCDMTNSQCIKQPPSYVSRNKDCDGQSGNIDGTKGHDIVKVCPQVVKFITCSVVAARDNGNQQTCYPTSNSSTPTPSTPSATSSDLTHVDWANFTYTFSGDRAGQSVKATNGKGTLDQFTVSFLPPTYGDLNGDGQVEAAIIFQVCGADCGPSEFVVYTGTVSHPIVMGEPSLSFNSPGGQVYWGPDTVTIQNEIMTLTGRGYSEAAAHCCPDLHIESSYRWNGSQFVVVDSNATRLEAGHVLVVKTDTPILDVQGNPIAPRCQGPHNDTGAIVPAGWSVVALRDSPIPQPGNKENLYVAYPDPCQPGNDFSHNDTIANGSGAVGYVAFSDLTSVSQVKPHPAFPTTRGTAWRDCWGPTTCGDARYPNENDILTSRDPVLYAWWTGSYWDPHWWHVLDTQGQEAAVYGRDWIAVG
jgi:hypothetical protein